MRPKENGVSRTMLAISFPTLVYSMPPSHQLATTASATLVTILGSVCSAAWYYTGASTAYAAVTAMPE
eukprot:8873695-Karenia_brevis.AAC.1